MKVFSLYYKEMKCKYYDCGWCYAPPDIETNAYAGSCIEPLSCPYLTGNKPLMTTQKEQQLKQMTNQTPCNHRTPPKYNVEYLDDKMVIVNGVSYTRTERTPIVIQEDENTIVVAGVKYQRIVEEPKPQTLYNSISNLEKPMFPDDVINTVRKWLPNTKFEDGTDYNIGWNDCLQHLENNLR